MDETPEVRPVPGVSAQSSVHKEVVVEFRLRHYRFRSTWCHDSGEKDMDRVWERAIRQADVRTVGELLARGSNVDALDRYGQTGLMLAAHGGSQDIVELLIRHGASLDVTARFGLSALMLAVVGGHEQVARILAEAGADLALRGSGAPGFAGKTARDLASAQGLHDLATDLASPVQPDSLSG